MVRITIDTEKDSKEVIINAIEFLQNLLNQEFPQKISDEIQITTTHSEPDFFRSSMPSTESMKKQTSANELLNMFDSDEDEELKPKKDLADFSQFMKW
ncbi:MAG: hypothetical protein AB7V77_04400 [Candidatus Woesearchaeota archaeon]